MLLSDLIVLGLLLAVGLWTYGRRLSRAGRVQRGMAEARKNYEQAAELLAERGYTLLDVGPRVVLTTRVDGRDHQTSVQADLIAGEGRRTYVVHLRGQDGRRLTTRRLRQQLLEYVVAYRPHGVLLVDVERKRVRRVEFRVQGEAGRRIADLARWLGAAGTGAALTYAAFRLAR